MLNFLNRLLRNKKHEVLKMQWQKAELERKLIQLKQHN